MARGLSPIDVPIPLAGWHTDKPLHKLPFDSLISSPGDLASMNVFVDWDGLLKPRLGYELLHDFGERIMGGFYWTDNGGNAQVFVITLTHAYVLQSDGTWLEITGTGIHCLPDFPARIVQFGDNFQSIYWVNGVLGDTLRKWTVGSPTYVDVLFNAGPLKANDLAVIGDRLVLVNTFEFDGFHPSRVRWSATLDGTTYKALAYNPLLDADAGALVAIRPTSRTSAVLYTANGPPYSMSAQQGSDASAFAFDRIQNGLNGPVNAAAIVNIGGVHVYLAPDQHVYECDGTSARSISPAIDAFLASSAGLLMGFGQHPVAVYDKKRMKVWVFCAFFGDSEASHALLFDLQRGAWEPPQTFPDGVTTAFTLVEQLGPTWDNPGISAQSTLDSAIGTTATQITLASGAGLTPSGVVQIGTEMLEYGNIIFGDTLTGAVRGAFGTTAAAHAGGDAVIQTYSWDTAPWASWDAIPATGEPALWIGMSDGKLCRFQSASTDRGFAIAWSATWGLLNPGPENNVRINTVDIQVNPQLNSVVPISEPFAIALDSLKTPYDAAPTNILQATVLSGDPSTWYLRLNKAVAQGANVPSNLVRLHVSGTTSKNAPWLAGIVLYADINSRGDPGGGYPA